MQFRRRTDPPNMVERRVASGDRRVAAGHSALIRFPSRQEQAIQFLTRYLFALLGVVFFNYSPEFAPRWLLSWQMNLVLGAYLLINSLNFLHAWLRPVSVMRYRFALWLDIVMVSACVLNDPNNIPPSLVAYIVVVLGNGMRYGMRFFAEAIVGTVLGGGAAVVLRQLHLADVISPGMIFLSLFGIIIVVYAYILMGRVETARHRSEQVSRTDPLTGLLNRRGLADSASAWVSLGRREEQRLIVMFADLDHFKTVNDHHGHAEGDRVLVKVADLLLDCTRSGDLVARYGGDEFVLMLSEIELSDAHGIAQRIESAVEDWMRANEFMCGISIGVSEVPPGEFNFNDVLQSVDRLLYEVKNKRGSRRGRQILLSSADDLLADGPAAVQPSD